MSVTQAAGPATGFPHVAAHGIDGLVVRFADVLTEPANRAALAFRAQLEREGWDGVEETAPALASVFLRFDPAAIGHSELVARIERLLASRAWYGERLSAGRRAWRIPTVFGGPLAPQLDEAAALAGLDAAAAVAALSTARVRVLTIGFAPGQPYLGELPPAFAIPRQRGLTPRVPEGALTLALRQFVLFANPSPTGWRHVGQTAFRCFRPEATDPFPLRPGDEAVFEAIDEERLARIRSDDPAGGGATAEPIR